MVSMPPTETVPRLLFAAPLTNRRGSELLREVAWVVFDEVHYMQVRCGCACGCGSTHAVPVRVHRQGRDA